MKNSFLLGLLILTTLMCSAQDKGFIAVSLGSSNPIGDFASTNPNNKAAGYAKAGFLFDIAGGFKFSKHFGMAMLIRGQANPTDAQALADQTLRQVHGATGATVNSGAWSIGGYMVGAYSSFPVSKIMSIESRAMFGFLTATSPDMTVNVTDGTSSVWVKEHSASSSTFAYLLGIGYKINSSKHFCLSVNIDYLGANPEFSDVLTTTSAGDSSRSTFSQSFGTINYGFGLGYRFGTKTLSIKDL